MVSLVEFLQRRAAPKGAAFTHTSLASPAGSYSVSSADHVEFVSLCSAALDAGHSLHLTERPARWFPVVVDLDFRYDLADGADRRHGLDFVTAFVKVYAAALRSMLSEDRPTIKAIVMEREAPYADKKVLKDGVHVLFPDVVMTAPMQRVARTLVLPSLPALLEGLGVVNSAEDVLDHHTTSNNWQLYGSCKPGRGVYVVTATVTVSESGDAHVDAVRPQEARAWRTWLEATSLRIPRNRDASVTDSISAATRDLEMEEFRQAKAKLVSSSTYMTDQARGRDGPASEEELETARAFAGMLSTARADAYDDWIRVGWALRNTDQRLLPAWVAFSRRSAKFVEGQCESLWAHMKCERDARLTVRSVRRWAAEDDPAAFAAYTAESRTEVVSKSLTGTSYDMALLVHSMYRDEFVCTSVKHKTFYQFGEHRWKRLDSAVSLRDRLSTLVYALVQDAVAAAGEQGGGDDEAGKGMKRIVDGLRSTMTKDNIVRECCDIFHANGFEQRLDEHQHLLGFENGVYDLEEGRFRDGRPEDMLTLSTGNDYVPLDPDSADAAEIEAYFAQVFIEEELREYVIGRFASFLTGTSDHEHFYIFTGTGSNSKSMLISFFEMAFGGYCCKLPTSLVTQKRASSGSACGELARTKSLRFAVIQEPGESERLNVGIIKELSGGDKILARALYGDPFEFKPQFSMVMTCNTLPEVPDNDGGTWRRIRVVEFGSRFVSTPTKKNEFQMDPTIVKKMERWKQPFMSMLIERHRADRGKKLVEPPQVLAMTARYRHEQDSLSCFVSECLTRRTGDSVVVRELHVVYKEWVRGNMAGASRADQIPAMVTKLKNTDLGEPVGEAGTALGSHLYIDWVLTAPA
jgi:P4 family phage/plasmid primase-like protien